MKLIHNTHMLLPEALWKKLRERAAIEGRSITEIVVEAAYHYLEKRPRAKADTD